jgi:hypothetical protein
MTPGQGVIDFIVREGRLCLYKWPVVFLYMGKTLHRCHGLDRFFSV